MNNENMTYESIALMPMTVTVRNTLSQGGICDMPIPQTFLAYRAFSATANMSLLTLAQPHLTRLCKDHSSTNGQN